MKKILVTAFALILGNANAQYFEHVYGSKQIEEVSSGMNTVLTGPSFQTGGMRASTIGANVAISMLRTDMSGTPFFKNNYGIYFNSSLTPLMRVRQAFVIELSPTLLGIVGVCYKDQTLQKQCVYFAKTDQNG